MDPAFYDVWECHPAIGIVVISVVLAVWTPIAVLVRVIGGENSGRKLWMDKCVVVTAMVFLVAFSILTCLMGNEKIDNLASRYKIYQASFACYKVATVLGKTSLVLYFVTEFPYKRFRVSCWIFVALVASQAVLAAGLSILQCIPFSRGWDRSIPGNCINSTTLLYVDAWFGLATNAIVLLLPAWYIAKLPLSDRIKIDLAVAGILGMIMCGECIIRASALTSIPKSHSLSTQSGYITMWSLLEAHTLLMCACAPYFQAILTRWIPRISSALRTPRRTPYPPSALSPSPRAYPRHFPRLRRSTTTDSFSSQIYLDDLIPPPPAGTTENKALSVCSSSLYPSSSHVQSMNTRDPPPSEELMLAMGCHVVRATRTYDEVNGLRTTYHNPVSSFDPLYNNSEFDRRPGAYQP
ncbi:hypothetical protein AJ80_04328 [Polytolypa hystricis UAMH7299]|uniref:Rhodopsin domain-containing protein n=1 Tax=Polytolypa hystricis (strain UAMH7299) TaxID=1447883 RepID=A0A2B7YCU5_POLH7|nr:hypothetical protein AJ80_04328 [Polytolypa hystricis UAMH7299]